MTRFSCAPKLALASLLALLAAACDSTTTSTIELQVNAGADQSVGSRSTVQVQATAKDAVGDLTYSWSQVSGPVVTFSDPAIANPTFTAPEVAIDATEIVELAVSIQDETERVGADTITITIQRSDTLVFRGELRNTSTTDLNAYDLGTKKIVTISNMFDPGLWVDNEWSFQPMGNRVVFRVNGRSDGLYAAEVTGANLAELTAGSTNESPNFYDYMWSVDGVRVLFRSDRDVSGDYQAYSVLPDGTALTMLHPTLPAGTDVDDILAAAGDRVVLYGDLETAGVNELFSSLGDGTGFVKISQPLVATAAIAGYTLTESRDRLIYRADAETDGVFELYATDLDGGNHVKLSGAPMSSINAWEVSPTGTRVAYIVDQDTSGIVELYSVGVDGTGMAKVSGAMQIDGDISAFYWAPNGERLAYMADQDTDTVTELYVGAADGSARAKINGALVSGARIRNMRWSPDSNYVGYVADERVDSTYELFTAKYDGTEKARASRLGIDDAEVNFYFVWSPDSTRLLFVGDLLIESYHELFVAPRDGSSLTRMSGLLVGSGPWDYTWSPDGSGVSYVAYQQSWYQALYYTAADGSGNVRLGPKESYHEGYAWNPDGSSVFILAHDRDTSAENLFETTVAAPVPSNLTETAEDAEIEHELGFQSEPDANLLGYYYYYTSR